MEIKCYTILALMRGKSYDQRCINSGRLNFLRPIQVTTRFKAWVCGRPLAGIAGSNPAGGHGCLSLVSVVCCQVEVSATG